jgi:hypothetical protein
VDTLYGTPLTQLGARWWSSRAQGAWPGGPFGGSGGAAGGGMPGGEMRIGDAERSKVAEDLSKHYADGRLDESEFNERLSKAMSAKTRSDLSGLLIDLPRLDLPQPAAQPPRRRGAGTRLVGFALVALVALSILSAISWQWHFPFFLFFLIAFLVWRRHHRHLHRWHGGHGPGIHGPGVHGPGIQSPGTGYEHL